GDVEEPAGRGRRVGEDRVLVDHLADQEQQPQARHPGDDPETQQGAADLAQILRAGLGPLGLGGGARVTGSGHRPLSSWSCSRSCARYRLYSASAPSSAGACASDAGAVRRGSRWAGISVTGALPACSVRVVAGVSAGPADASSAGGSPATAPTSAPASSAAASASNRTKRR